MDEPGDNNIESYRMRHRDDEPLLEASPMTPATEEWKFSWKTVLIIIVVIAAILASIFLVRHIEKTPDLLQNFLDFCNGLAEDKPVNWLLVFGMVCWFQLGFLPGQSWFVTILSFFIGDYFRAVLRFVVIIWPVKTCGFLLIKYCIYEKAFQLFKDNDIYQAINIESKKNPWTISFMMSFVWIMSSVKMYLISLTAINIWHFVPFMLPSEFLYVCLFAFIGVSIKDISAYLKGDSKEMSSQEKWTYFIFVGFIVLTFCFVGIVMYKIYGRVMHLKEQHKLEQRALQDSPQFRDSGNVEVLKDRRAAVELPEGTLE